MTEHLSAYLPIFVHLVLVIGLTALLLGVHTLVGRRRPSPAKLMPYESGVWPIGSSRERVPIRYYLIAMLFILFDIEAVFLYPWAVVFRDLGLVGLLEVLVFVGILLIGFVYAWQRKALEWE